MNARAIGDWAANVAKQIWPSIELEPWGSEMDCRGRDARDNGRGIQIKGDTTIATSGKVFYELWKRGGEWSGHGGFREWHTSSSWAHEYIFVSIGFAIRVSCAELSRVACRIDCGPREILPTARGLLIPINALKEKIVRFHTVAPPRAIAA